MRSAVSASAPRISQAPSPTPAAASALRGSNRAQAASAASTASPAATASLCSTPGRSPRFHASSGPAGRIRKATAISGTKVRAK